MNLSTIFVDKGLVTQLHGLHFKLSVDGRFHLDDELLPLTLDYELQPKSDSESEETILKGFINTQQETLTEDTSWDGGKDKILIYFKIRNDRISALSSIETKSIGHRPLVSFMQNDFCQSFIYVLNEGTWILHRSGSSKCLYFCEGGELVMYDISKKTWPRTEVESELTSTKAQSRWFCLFRKQKKPERRIRYV